MADLSDDEILDLVKKHESGGLNVTNYMYDPTHTAQGYYQITNDNWGKIGPKIGIDTKKYPNAMAAPEDVQRKVAHYLLTKTPKGALNWESPAFRKAAGITDDQEPKKEMADPRVMDVKQLDPNDPSSMSDEDLAKEIAALKGQIQTKKDAAKPKEDKRSTFEKYATTPDIANLPPLPFAGADWVSNVTIPGIKQMIRGARGYKLPGQTDYSEAGKIADVGEGALKVLAPAGAPAFAAAPAAGLLTLGLGAMGDYGARKGAELFGATEDQQRVAGLAGGLIAGGLPGLLRGRSLPTQDLNIPTRAQGAFEAFGPSERRIGGIKKMFTGQQPESKVGPPPQKYPSYGVHEDMIANASSGPERLEARAKMVESLKAQNFKEEDAIRMADNAFRKAETADAEKAQALAEKNAPKPEKPPKITYQQMDRNVAAVPANSRMALKQRYMEVLTQQGMPADIAEQHFNTALTEAHQNDLDLARKADADAAKKAADEGPSAKKIQDLKDMLAKGTLPSEDYAQQMARWLDPETIQRDIAEGRQKWLGIQQPKINLQGQNLDPASIRTPPSAPPQGLVQMPQGGFNSPMGERAPTLEGLRQQLASEPSNLTKFKVTSGPQEERPTFGPPVKPPGYVPPPEEPTEIPVASTKLVHNAAQALFKGNYDLDKIPADNRDWRLEFKEKNKLASIPTEKTVREAVGIVRVMKARAARGEYVPPPPQVKVERGAGGRFYRVDAP